MWGEGGGEFGRREDASFVLPLPPSTHLCWLIPSRSLDSFSLYPAAAASAGVAAAAAAAAGRAMREEWNKEGRGIQRSSPQRASEVRTEDIGFFFGCFFRGAVYQFGKIHAV